MKECAVGFYWDWVIGSCKRLLVGADPVDRVEPSCLL